MRHDSKRHGGFLDTLALAGLMLYTGVLSYVTLADSSQAGRITGFAWRIARKFIQWGYDPVVVNFLTDFIANIVLFVPFGLLSLIVLGRYRWPWVLFLGLVATISIELAQTQISSRFPSIWDVISNFLGTAIGVGIGLGFLWILRKLSQK